MAPDKATDALRATLEAIAPGTGLRDGLERILRAQTGALVVLGDGGVEGALAQGGHGVIQHHAESWAKRAHSDVRSAA